MENIAGNPGICGECVVVNCMLDKNGTRISRIERG
jgi:hypothetical protein